MRLSVVFLAVLAVAFAVLTEKQCKRKQRFWRLRCLPNGWKTDNESCKGEMQNLSPLTKRRTKKCSRLENEMKATGEAYCWPVDCSEEIEPSEAPTDKPGPTPEELCEAADKGFKDNKCESVICNSKSSNSIGGCDKFYEKLTSDCSFILDCPKPEPTPEELCQEAQKGFSENKCSSVICNSKASNSIGDCDGFYKKLQSDCGFTLDCPEIAMCPKSHPYAYHTDNAYCCQFSKEKVDVEEGSSCDGSEISAGSMCCKDDAYVKCPAGKNCVNNPDGEKYDGACPLSHPYAYWTDNQYCCKYNKEKLLYDDGINCDESALHDGSMCCYRDAYVKCPSGRKCADNPDITASEGGCPKSHPYAYWTDKKYCCQYNKEKVDSKDGAACDGSEIDDSSSCCYNDAFVECPSGEGCSDYTELITLD